VTLAGQIHEVVEVFVKVRLVRLVAKLMVKVAVPMAPSELTGEMIVEKTPFVVGVPYIRPVPESTLRPGGRPVAE
jgi:hypothetical protein